MEPRAALLTSSFNIAHMVFNAVVADLTADQAAFTLPGGMVPSSAAMIAHVLYGEDVMIRDSTGGTLALDGDDFANRTGIIRPQPAMTPDWLSLKFDIDGLKAYSEAVFARTSAFLQSATAADLDRLVPTPLGNEMPVAEYLAGIGVTHIAEHTGEVSTLKGAQGVRGLPF